jgi:hypothetical protein
MCDLDGYDGTDKDCVTTPRSRVIFPLRVSVRLRLTVVFDLIHSRCVFDQFERPTSLTHSRCFR